MKNIRFKIVTALFIIMLGLIIGGTNSYAASASISASSKNVSVGTKVTITVSGSAKAWSLKASGSGVSGNIVGGNLSSKSNQSFSESYTLNTSKAGTYKVSLSGDVTDANGTTTDIGDSVTVTVSEKSTSRDNTTDTNNNNTDNNKKQEEKKSEPTFKSANDTMYATGDINVRKSYSADSDKIGSLKTGEKVTRTGVGDNGWSKVSYNGGTGYIKTSLLTDKEPKKSDDKSLKSLSIEGFEINPAFDPEITDYAVTFDKDIDKLDVKAEANNEKAKVEINGNEGLKDGDNVIKITVTAEDETTRLYSITATKQSAAAATLSTLKVKGYTLSPAFSPDVKEYKLTILDANIDKLDITAETKIKDAKVEILGNSGLKNGDNIIQIKVTSPDGTKNETYKIIASKNVSGTTTGNTENKSSNWILYAGIGIIVLLVIAIIVVFIMSRRNAYYEDDEEYDDEEDENNEQDKQQDDYSDLYGYSTKSEVKNVESGVSKSEEKDKFINDSILGNTQTSNENVEQTPKYEDGFNYNAFNTKDIYGDYNENKEIKNEEPTGIKDVDYYSNKVSEMFDTPDAGVNKTSDDAFGYLPKDESIPEQSDEYTPMDNNWSDDNYRPRRSKGKHSK